MSVRMVSCFEVIAGDSLLWKLQR